MKPSENTDDIQISTSTTAENSSDLSNLEYNTQRDALVLKEYGRNMQNMVRHLKTIEDINERTQAAETLISLMKQLNPSVRENSDNIHRIWDHLYIMADGEIEFNNEFLPQTEEERTRRPDHIGYTQEPVKYRHYGRNVELLVEKAAQIEDPEDLLQAVADIGKLMKSFYLTWNRDSVEDEVILKDIKRLSNKKIDIDLEIIQQDNLFELGTSPRQLNPKQDVVKTNRSRPTRTSSSSNSSTVRRTPPVKTTVKKNRRKKRRK